MNLTTKELVICAISGALLFISFTLCSNILYLEIITNMVVLLSMVYKRKLAILSVVVFSFTLLLSVGFQIYTVMYLLVYVLYSIITIAIKEYLLAHPYFKYAYIGVLSFLTGQILQLPWMLISKKATLYYMLMGLKTSLIQGGISFIFALLVFDVLYDRLKKILKGEFQE